MTNFDKQFVEGFRGAAHQEVMDGEEQFMADMAEIFTPESIDEGVYIDFGSNRERFEQVLGLLKLDELVAHERLQVTQTVVGFSSGISRKIGWDRVGVAAQEHGVLRTLEALQSEAWESRKLDGIWPYVTTGIYPNVVSEMSLGNLQPASSGDGYVPVPDTLIITVRNYVQYGPQTVSEYGEIAPLNHYVEEFKADRNNKDMFKDLLAMNQDEFAELSLPDSGYSLILSGGPYVSGDILNSSLSSRFLHMYDVSNGRVKQHVDPYLVDWDTQD